MNRRKNILGVPVDDYSRSEALNLVESWFDKPGFRQIITLNSKLIG